MSDTLIDKGDNMKIVYVYYVHKKKYIIIKLEY